MGKFRRENRQSSNHKRGLCSPNNQKFVPCAIWNPSRLKLIEPWTSEWQKYVVGNWIQYTWTERPNRCCSVYLKKFTRMMEFWDREAWWSFEIGKGVDLEQTDLDRRSHKLTLDSMPTPLAGFRRFFIYSPYKVVFQLFFEASTILSCTLWARASSCIWESTKFHRLHQLVGWLSDNGMCFMLAQIIIWGEMRWGYAAGGWEAEVAVCGPQLPMSRSCLCRKFVGPEQRFQDRRRENQVGRIKEGGVGECEMERMLIWHNHVMRKPSSYVQRYMTLPSHTDTRPFYQYLKWGALMLGSFRLPSSRLLKKGK